MNNFAEVRFTDSTGIRFLQGEGVGVVGGISIIGTSGIVSPLSNEAFIESVRREMEVAQAIGCVEIALVSGKTSEDALCRESNITFD